MQRVGFVGEAPDTPLPTPNVGARLLNVVASLLAVAAVLVVSVGSLILGGWVTPFHYYDDMIVVAVALGPALLVLASSATRNGTMLLVSFGRPIKALNAVAGLAVFLVIVPGNFALWANQHFDASPGVDMVLPVQDKWIRSGRHGSRSYMASVVPDVGSPLGRWSMYGTQPVRLPRAEWERLVDGRSALVLRRHAGRLGFPWYEPEPEVLPQRAG